MAEETGKDTKDGNGGAQASGQRLPAPELHPRKERRISWIWLVPLVAVLVGATLLMRDWMATGPSITVAFESAEGIEVGQTRVRYKDVAIGVVTDIKVDHQRGKVLVTAQLHRDGADYITQPGSRFWVVRPRLAISGVSGLGTLLSGVYIAVDTPPSSAERDKAVYEFEGLEQPPEISSERPGTRYTLRAPDLGWLDIGSPVYYRRIQVGQVIGYSLDESGDAVNIQIFIDAPHDRYVTTDARFWNASGINFSLDAEGVSVQTGSLAAVLAGGVAFASADEFNKEWARADAVFALHGSEAKAMADPDGDPVLIEFHFHQSIRGLKLGAPVDFRGLELGTVVDIDMEFDRERRQFFALVQARIYPLRFGPLYQRIMELDKDPHIARARFLENMVGRGLRAQMRAANLLTGQQYVALDFFKSEPDVVFDGTQYPPVLPTITGDFDRLQQQLGSIVGKIDALPLDAIAGDLRDTLQAVTALLSGVNGKVTPELASTLRSVRKTLSNVDGFVSEGAATAGGLEGTMRELAAAARALRSLADYLQAQPNSLIRGSARDRLEVKP
ncbi:MCE family protein [Alcaligenaceae bacterium]|nr:MCE family protein [Alcaligenaceae bacterium]